MLKFNAIKCHEVGAFSKFCSSRRRKVCIVWDYWEGFLKKVELEVETDINLFLSSMHYPEWSESASGGT